MVHHSVIVNFCRELQLGHNQLRILPYELGKLFNLMVLGLMGNSLGKDIMTIYSEPNGTQKLLTFMLDNLQGMFIYFSVFMFISYSRYNIMSLLYRSLKLLWEF